MSVTVAARPSDPGVSPLSPGELSLALEGRLIVVSGYGLWTPPQIAEHLRSYAEMVARVRGAHGNVRVLVGLKDAGIQIPEVTEILARETALCRRDGDRIALVVSSALAKIQMRRILGDSHHQYFVSEKLAREWLSVGAA